MNFFVNAAMGIGNSGVEHAQFYRAKRFDQAGLPYRFIFLDIIPELHRAMDRWGLRDDQVIDIWEYFVLGEQYMKHGLRHRGKSGDTEMVIDGTNTQRKSSVTTDSGIRIERHFVKHSDIHHPNNKVLLVRTARTELFNAKTNERKVMYENIDDPHEGEVLANIHLYHENGQHLFFRNRVDLYRYFFEQLDRVYGAPSTFIIDRGENSDEALMRKRIPHSKLVYMIHADHLSDRNVPAHPLWNNHYEYLLDNISAIDRVVVATKLQREDLLVDFPKQKKTFVAIPVGGVRDKPADFKHRSLGSPIRLITASRLASEKHIDLAVKAVAKLHDQGIDIIFDIYGQGGEQSKLEKTIKELHAGSYVTLKGLSNELDKVYPQYDAFISASYSEGFGLTYIEALNAALPIVTFKARFGAMELVEDSVNGFLQDFKRDDEDYNVLQLAEGINRLRKANYAKLRKNTQITVKDYRDQVIANEWRDMIDGL